MSPLGIFGLGPKFSVQCGGCDIWFRTRIEVVDSPPAACPYCDAINILPLVKDRG